MVLKNHYLRTPSKLWIQKMVEYLKLLGKMLLGNKILIWSQSVFSQITLLSKDKVEVEHIQWRDLVNTILLKWPHVVSSIMGGKWHYVPPIWSVESRKYHNHEATAVWIQTGIHCARQLAWTLQKCPCFGRKKWYRNYFRSKETKQIQADALYES